MDFRDRHVVVTGGTGALGRAVVDALLAAGAHCHVPYRQEREKEDLPTGALSLIPVPSLADEAAVVKLYGSLPSLWASIHIAGGFAFAPLRGSRAWSAATLTMRPPALPRRIAVTASRQQRKQLTRLSSISRRSNSPLVSVSGAKAKPPAIWIEAQSAGSPP